MSYSQLHQLLVQTTDKLEQYRDKLGSPELNKKAESLRKSLVGFDKALDNYLLDSQPGVKQFETLLNSEKNKKVLKKEAMMLLYRRLFDDSPSARTPAAIRKEAVNQVKKLNMGEDAVAELKRFLKEFSQPAPVPKDKYALQKEFLRFGSLSEEQYLFEIKSRFSAAQLRQLAKANGIPATTKTKRATLETTVRKNSLRAYDHIQA